MGKKRTGDLSNNHMQAFFFSNVCQLVTPTCALLIRLVILLDSTELKSTQGAKACHNKN